MNAEGTVASRGTHLLDIKQVFDTITSDAIKRAMAAHGIEIEIRECYGNYLNGRTCSAKLGSSKIMAKQNKGSLQGALGSPILWNRAFDKLLYYL
jgi:hypothetical protein